MFTKYVPGTHTVAFWHACRVCSMWSVYVHVLTLDACMEGWVLCLHFLAINTQSYRTKTTVNVSSEAMAQLVECSLTM